MIKDKLSLNDVEWGEFRIKDLFDKIEKGKCTNQNIQTKRSDKGISYLSATKVNNGTSDFVERNERMQKGNCIMFVNQGDGGAGYSVYKSEDFISTSSNSFGYATWVNKNTGLFFSTISSKLKEKYSFGYGRTEKRLERDKIILPIDKNGEPNWQFMEDYIKQEQKIIAQKVINYYEDKIIKTGFDLLGLEDAKWGCFKIKDIFDIKAVKGKTLSSYPEGATPYVSTSGLNNGVSGYVDAKDNISNEKCISIDPIAGKAFYHNYKFVGRGGAGSAINLLYNQNLDENNAQFILTMIEKVSREKASYGVALNGDRLKNMRLTLPVDEKGEPHWDYMSKFMQKIEQEKLEKALNYIYNLAICEARKLPKLEEKEWGEFWLEDIFVKIQRGKRLKKDNHIIGNTPYVSSTAINNGLDCFIGNDKNIRIFENNLSLANSGSVGACFYHKYKYIASDHVTSLSLKKSNEYIYKFMSTIISRLEEKYSFNREINDKRIRKEKILLPINKLGKPDYSYMKKYMQIEEIKQAYKIIDYYIKSI